LLGVVLDLGGGLRDLVGELDELGVLGHEVGLGVDLDHGVSGDGNEALGGGALSALADVLGALDAQNFDGLVKVAVGFDEGVLAGLHAGAGELAQLLDVGGGEIRHVRRSSLVSFVGWAAGGGPGDSPLGQSPISTVSRPGEPGVPVLPWFLLGGLGGRGGLGRGLGLLGGRGGLGLLGGGLLGLLGRGI